MKKLVIFVFMLIWVLNGLSIAGNCQHTATKKMNQKKVVEFMKNYYKAYNQYAQDAETIDMLDSFWAPEFVAVAYFPLPEYPRMDLEFWKGFLVMGHLQALEKLESEEIIVDTQKMKVVIKVNVKHFDRFSGALLLELQGVGMYDLKIDANNSLKITSMKFFCSNPMGLMELYNMLPN